MLKIYNKRGEEQPLKQGINWTWDKANKPMIVIKLYKVALYYRRRSTWVMEGNNWQLPRHLFAICKV